MMNFIASDFILTAFCYGRFMPLFRLNWFYFCIIAIVPTY